MNRQALRACVVKELLLLSRDWHALALLFVMPAIFILIMSLALKNQFDARAGKRIVVEVTDLDRSAASRQLIERLSASSAFDVQVVAQAKPRVSMHFALVIERGFGEQLLHPDPNAAPVTLEVSADAQRQMQMIVAAAIREDIGRQSVDAVVAALRTMLEALSARNEPAGDVPSEPQLEVKYAYGGGTAPPTSVQQNVPAWMVFAVFFVAIPVSTAVVRERQMGTLRRLRTTTVGDFTLLLGKLLPYFAVNQLQVLVMLAVGAFVVPLLGGDALAINGSPIALSIMAGAVSIAALGYALLIAVVARTTEQATIIGGAGTIVLAAIGGIMVPKFVMPQTMQSLTYLSPLSWGLEGFLNVLLRGGQVQSVLANAGALSGFGLVALLLASFAQRRRDA